MGSSLSIVRSKLCDTVNPTAQPVAHPAMWVWLLPFFPKSTVNDAFMPSTDC